MISFFLISFGSTPQHSLLHKVFTDCHSQKCRHVYRNVLNILTVLLHHKIIKTYCKKSCKTRTVIILLLSLFFLLYCSFYRIKDIVVQKNNGNEKRDMENNYEPCLYSRFAAKYWILTLVHALALRKLNFMTQGP